FDNALHLIEKGFNDVMDRASGWYKRKIALVTLILGLFLALALNADSLELTGRLYNDPAVRAALAAEAQAAVQKVQPEGTTADPAQITQQVLQQSQALTPLLGNWPETPDGKNQGFWWFFKVLGILLTGFAVSLGAPFWFDTLGKLVSLRGAGPKPAPPANRVNEDSAGV
ncbi:MAG TPA: hypothetical protein VN963_04475, partial [bacterium]|nr:hypothetical protein [bacterium]